MTELSKTVIADVSHIAYWENAACALLSEALRTGGEWMSR